MKEINDFLKKVRKDYDLDQLDINTVDTDPIVQFAIWMKMAVDSGMDDPNAFNLATVSADGKPSSRIVLLRNFDELGFVFFTNYHSHKGKDIESNPYAAINFYWPLLHKQVRIEGKIEKVEDWDSDDYFSSRPKESQVGAWASLQSQPLADRHELEQKVDNLTREFEGKEVSRPPHWGGYRVRPLRIEFWQGRPNRLHDRILYEFTSQSNWKISRLYP